MADENKAQLTDNPDISGKMESALLKIRSDTAPLDKETFFGGDMSIPGGIISQTAGNEAGAYKIVEDGIKATEKQGAVEVAKNIGHNWDKLSLDEQKGLEADPKFMAAWTQSQTQQAQQTKTTQETTPSTPVPQSLPSQAEIDVAEQKDAAGRQIKSEEYKLENAAGNKIYDALSSDPKTKAVLDTALNKELQDSFAGMESAKGTGKAGTFEQFAADHKGAFLAEDLQDKKEPIYSAAVGFAAEHLKDAKGAGAEALKNLLENNSEKTNTSPSPSVESPKGEGVSPPAAEKHDMANDFAALTKDIGTLSKDVLALAKEAVGSIVHDKKISGAINVAEASAQSFASAVEKSLGSGRGGIA